MDEYNTGAQTNLQQTQHRIRRLHKVRVRRILHVSARAELIPHQNSTGVRRRVHPRKEVANVHRRALQRVLQPKGIEDEHRVVEVELRDELFVLCSGRRFHWTRRELNSLGHLYLRRGAGLTIPAALIYPLVLPCKYLRLERLDDQQIITVGLQSRRRIRSAVEKLETP
jgi:hypothetical protein